MGLREHLRSEPVRGMRLRPLVVAPPHTPIGQAAAMMRQRGVGAVVVVDGEQRPIGMFNEKRLIRALATVDHAMSKPVGDFMDAAVRCVGEDEPIAQLIGLMKREQVRSVCVVDRGGRPVALAGVRTLIEHLAEYFARSVKVQPLDSTVTLTQREGA